MGIQHSRVLRRVGAGWLLALGLGSGAAADAEVPVVPTVAVQAVRAGSGFDIDGSLQALKQSTLAAQVGGNVVNLAVKAGDRVKTGQLIARIDERDALAGLARSQAGVAQAEAEARNAKVQAERTRELRAQGFISQAALDVAETQAQAAQAALAQAQAGRSQAALARGYTLVTAPFDAVVLATHVEAGELATPGRPIATVYAPGALRAVVQVPASRASTARAAHQVRVWLQNGAAGGRWVTPIRQVPLPTADPVTQTVEWRLDLPASETAAALPGQTVKVRFTGAPAAAGGGAEALAVPAAAVLRRGELTAVYVVQGERFVLRAVRTGAPVGASEVEVVAGLRAGESVATDPVKAGLAGAQPAAK